MRFLSEGVRTWYLDLIEPVVKFFIRLEINPNHLTTLGFFIQLIAVYFLAAGNFLVGGILIWLAGTSDIIDGKIARSRGAGTKFGALYDSTLDRYAEFAMFFGIGYYFIKHDEPYIYTIISFVALGGSLMTSYIRARSEGLGVECKVGVMQRPERIAYIGLASILSAILSSITPVQSPYPLIVLLIIISVTANYTAFQRLSHVYKLTNRGRDLLITDKDEKE